MLNVAVQKAQHVKINGFMKLYLSSYHLGDKPEILIGMAGKNKRSAVIPNALDGLKDKKGVIWEEL